MYKPKRSPISYTNQHAPLPNRFTLLCWNLQKLNCSQYQNHTIEQLLNIDEVHILSLQEASISTHQLLFFGHPFVMAPNIETRKRIHGVLTASAYKLSSNYQFLTKNRELGFATHKPAVITQHPLSNSQVLTHVNIHAINFVPHFIFRKEMNLIWHKVKSFNGPMIVSGDFNTWNRARLNSLLQATKQLNLTMVEFPDNKPIKTLNRKPLDHIFYRGLTLIQAQAMAVPISDHNPLIAEFSI